MTISDIQQRTAFVTGGSGFVGGRLIQALVAEGWRVRALARSDAAARTVTALGAQPVQGDMSGQAELQSGMEGAGIISLRSLRLFCQRFLLQQEIEMSGQVEDRLAISDLMIGWMRRDLAQWDSLRQLFHDDGVIEVTWFEGRFGNFADRTERGASRRRTQPG